MPYASGTTTGCRLIDFRCGMYHGIGELLSTALVIHSFQIDNVAYVMSEKLEKQIGQSRILGEAICAAMENELYKLGFEQAADLAQQFTNAKFELTRDPIDEQDGLKGTWLNAKGRSIGSILFYPEGAFYAEYDVVLPHPKKSQWFVEAITAWGRGDQVKTEARLLPNLS